MIVPRQPDEVAFDFIRGFIGSSNEKIHVRPQSKSYLQSLVTAAQVAYCVKQGRDIPYVLGFGLPTSVEIIYVNSKGLIFQIRCYKRLRRSVDDFVCLTRKIISYAIEQSL